MKFDFTLTPGQSALAEDNLAVIDKVISRYIHVNESVCGLGWDEARLTLCDLMAGASEEQHRLALSRLRGCTMAEAAQLQGMGVKRARRLLKELRQDHLLLNTETERGLNIHEY